MVERRLLKNFDFTLLVTAVSIVVCGCAMIYSANGIAYMQKQIVWAMFGLVAATLAASIDHALYDRIAGKLYVINLLLLIAVIALGDASKGARRWIGYGGIHIQPSEFAKIIIIIALAVFLVRRRDSIRTFKTFLWSFVYVGVPMLLVFKQPDLGTSLIFLAIWVAMVFVMGTNSKNILIFAGTAAAVALVVWNVPGVMKDYQKERIITFINPAADPRGSGYHVTQSRIAIGSGHMVGKGFRKGTQRELGFIPEQHTDFIFTVVGEELGFAGAATLIVLYLILMWRALDILSAAEDPTGRAIAAGIAGMFFFHITVNLGMTMGIMPVTGVPLPMFSYGGSSLMANLIAIGLLEGISMRRHKISF